MSENRRVVITGIGAISPNGIGKEAYWSALERGISGVRTVSYFDSSIFPSHLAGEARDFDPKQFLPEKVIKRTDRSTHLALAATQMAMDDAKLRLTAELQENIHVILGTAMSGHVSYIEQLRVYFTQGYRKVSPFAAVSCFPDACSGQLNIFFKFKGPAETICAGCAASTNAIMEGYKRIKMSETDVVIAGGTDAPISEEIFCGFCQARVLTHRDAQAPAPFDKNRDGTVLSEGAGILVLEEMGSALRRDALMYGEIVGYGTTTDAYQMAGADPSGQERIRALRLALKNAGVQPEEVDYVNAHGTGTRQNDLNETQVLKAVFGGHAKNLLVSSTKSMIGHAQGGCGALETIATLLALRKGIVHPTINYETPDEDCDLNYVVNQSIRKKIGIAVKNSFAFGGKNSVLVLKSLQNGKV